MQVAPLAPTPPTLRPPQQDASMRPYRREPIELQSRMEVDDTSRSRRSKPDGWPDDDVQPTHYRMVVSARGAAIGSFHVVEHLRQA